MRYIKGNNFRKVATPFDRSLRGCKIPPTAFCCVGSELFPSTYIVNEWTIEFVIQVIVSKSLKPYLYILISRIRRDQSDVRTLIVSKVVQFSVLSIPNQIRKVTSPRNFYIDRPGTLSYANNRTYKNPKIIPVFLTRYLKEIKRFLYSGIPFPITSARKRVLGTIFAFLIHFSLFTVRPTAPTGWWAGSAPWHPRPWVFVCVPSTWDWPPREMSEPATLRPWDCWRVSPGPVGDSDDSDGDDGVCDSEPWFICFDKLLSCTFYRVNDWASVKWKNIGAHNCEYIPRWLFISMLKLLLDDGYPVLMNLYPYLDWMRGCRMVYQCKLLCLNKYEMCYSFAHFMILIVDNVVQ